MSDELSRAEFERWMQALQRGFDGVHSRLDILNGRTRANEKDIAVLSDRSSEARKGGFIAGGVGAAIVAIAEAVRHLVAK